MEVALFLGMKFEMNFQKVEIPDNLSTGSWIEILAILWTVPEVTSRKSGLG